MIGVSKTNPLMKIFHWLAMDMERSKAKKKLVTLNLKLASLQIPKAIEQRKKVGKKSRCREDNIADMVDTVRNSDYYQKGIIFTNLKNSRNNQVYSRLLKDMQE